MPIRSPILGRLASVSSRARYIARCRLSTMVRERLSPVISVTEMPVVSATACLAVKQGRESCQLCWVYCPDACITRGAPPVIELAYCKGCGICAVECPTKAIEMVAEGEHAACEIEP